MAEVNALKPGDPGYVPIFQITVNGKTTEIAGKQVGGKITTGTGIIGFVPTYGLPGYYGTPSIEEYHRFALNPEGYIRYKEAQRIAAQQRAQDEAARKAEQEQLAAEEARLKAVPEPSKIVQVPKGQHLRETKAREIYMSDWGTYRDAGGREYTGAQVSQMAYERRQREAALGAELRGGARLTKVTPVGYEYVKPQPSQPSQTKADRDAWNKYIEDTRKYADWLAQEQEKTGAKIAASKAYAEATPAQRAVFHIGTLLSPKGTEYLGEEFLTGFDIIGGPVGKMEMKKVGAFYQPTFTITGAKPPPHKGYEEVVKETMAEEYLHKKRFPDEPLLPTSRMTYDESRMFKLPALEITSKSSAYERGALGSFESPIVQIELAGLTGAVSTAAAVRFAGTGGKIASGISSLTKGKTFSGFGTKAAYGTKTLGLLPQAAGAGMAGSYVYTRMTEAGEYVKAGERGMALGAGLTFAGELGALSIGARAQTKQEFQNQVQRNIRNIENEQARVTAETKLQEAKEFQKMKQPKPKEMKFSDLGRWPEAVRRDEGPLKRWFAEFSRESLRNVVGGSKAMQAQMTKSSLVGRSFVESDIDIYAARKPEQYAREFANMLKKQYKAERVSVVPRTGRVTYKGEKIAEFHPWENLEAKISAVEPWWKPSTWSVTKTPEGINIMRLQAQAGRKAIGGFVDPFTKGGMARPKDISDFARIKQAYAETGGPESYAKYLTEIGKIRGVKEVPMVAKGVAVGQTTLGGKRAKPIFIQKGLPGEIKATIKAEAVRLKALIRPPEGVTRTRVLRAERAGIRVQIAPSRAQVIGHETLHQTFPKFREAQILKLEREMVATDLAGAIERGMGWKAPAAKTFKVPTPTAPSSTYAYPSLGYAKMPPFSKAYAPYRGRAPSVTGYAVPRVPKPKAFRAPEYPKPPKPTGPIVTFPKPPKKTDDFYMMPKPPSAYTYPRGDSYALYPPTPKPPYPSYPDYGYTSRPPRQPPTLRLDFSNEVKKMFKPRRPHKAKYGYVPSVAGIFRYEWGGRRYYATKTPRSIATELRPIIIGKRRR